MDYFRSLFSACLPFNSLLQYIFQRLIGKYVKNNINLGNFALTGTSFLRNLELDNVHLTETFLKDFPISLFSGLIGQFNIKIPWTSILQDSIEVSIEDLFLDFVLEPKTTIKNEIIKEEKQKSEENDIITDNRIDVFKKIVNKILLNMCIELKNIRIRVFENSNSDAVLFQIRINELSIKKKSENNIENQIEKPEKLICSMLVDELENYFIKIDGITGNIANTHDEISINNQYNNLKNIENRLFPPISHPTTIFTINKPMEIFVQRKKLSDELKSVKLIIRTIEIIIEPFQINLIMKLIERFHECNILKEEIKLKIPEIQEINEKRIRSNSEIHFKTNFNSFQKEKEEKTRKLSISDLSNENKEEKKFLLKNIKEDVSQLFFEEKKTDQKINKKENDFNQNTNIDLISTLITDYIHKKPLENLNNNNKLTEIEALELPEINLEKKISENIQKPEKEVSIFLSMVASEHISLKIEIKLELFSLNILKKNTDSRKQDPFARCWQFSEDKFLINKTKQNFKKINIYIPSSFFKFDIKEMNIIMNKYDKIDFKINIRKINGYEIDLINNNKFSKEVFRFKNNQNREKSILKSQINKNNSFEEDDIFHSVNNSLSLSFLKAKELIRNLIFFKLDKNLHYCAFKIIQFGNSKKKLNQHKVYKNENNEILLILKNFNCEINDNNNYCINILQKREKFILKLSDLYINFSTKTILDIMNIVPKFKSFEKNENQENKQKNKNIIIDINSINFNFFIFRDEFFELFDFLESDSFFQRERSDQIKYNLAFGTQYFCLCEDQKSDFYRLNHPVLCLKIEKINILFKNEIQLKFELFEIGLKSDKINEYFIKINGLLSKFEENSSELEEIKSGDKISNSKESIDLSFDETVVENFSEKNEFFDQKLIENSINQSKFKLSLSINEIEILFFSKNFHFIEHFTNNLNEIISFYFPQNEQKTKLPLLSLDLSIKTMNIYINESYITEKKENILNKSRNLSQNIDISIYQSFIKSDSNHLFAEINLLELENLKKTSIILSVNETQIILIASDSLKIYFSIFELFLIDTLLKKIQMTCPLKLIEGASTKELRENLPNFCNNMFKSNFDKILLYKEFCNFQEFTNFSIQTLGKDKNRLFSEKNMINSLFEIINSEINLKIDLKGVVLKPNLKLSTFERINSFINQLEILKKKKMEKKSNLKLNFKIDLRNIIIDLHPFYDKTNIQKNPLLFNFKLGDLDNEKKGYFYSNTRSVVLFRYIGINGNLNENLNLNIEFKNIKFCLLQFFDFKACTNPLILIDLKLSLTHMIDTILESLGFIIILEINQGIFDFNQKNIKIKIGNINIMLAQDSIKAINKHVESIKINLPPIKNVKNENGIRKKEIIKNENKDFFEIDLNTFEDFKNKSDNDSFVLIDEKELLNEENIDKEDQLKIQEFLKGTSNSYFHNSKQKDPPILFFIDFSIDLFSISAFEGNHFDFNIESPNKSQDISNQNELKETDNKLVKEYFIYEKELKKNVSLFLLRKRNRTHNFSKSIKLQGSNLQFNCRLFNLEKQENLKYISRATLTLDNIEIIDSIISSKTNKILCKQKDDINFPFFLTLQLELIKRINSNNTEDIEIQCQLNITSIRLFLNGINLDFLTQFIQKDDLNEKELETLNEFYGQNTSHSENIDFLASYQNNFSNDFLNQSIQKPENNSPLIKSRYFFSLVHINSFSVIIDFDAVFENLPKLFENNIQLINIGNIIDLKLDFKQIILRGEDFDELLVHIIEIWKKDIILNQKPNIIKKLPYVNNAFNLIEGFFNVFYLPVNEITKGGNFENGFIKGLGGFAKALTVESLNFTEILSKGIGFGLKGLGINTKAFPKIVQKAREIINPEEKIKKGDKYKEKK